MARQHLRKTKSERKGNNRAKQEACHQNQLLRLSTALTVVATRGMWPYIAENALRHLDLCKLWPFKLLMPLDPISNIRPVDNGMNVSKRLLMRPMTGRRDMNHPSMHTSLIFLWLVTLCFYIDAKSILFVYCNELHYTWFFPTHVALSVTDRQKDTSEISDKQQ